MFQLLIVDDEAHWVESMAETMPWSTLDIDQVFKAYSAREALSIMAEQQIDVVITDIRMPEMSGLDLIREIRGIWSQTKCIVLSGYADFQYAKQAMQYQSFAYLTKPVEDDDLMEAVAGAIGQLKQEAETFTSYGSTLQLLQSNMSLLRSTLLLDLLRVSKLPEEQWLSRSQHLNLPFSFGDSCVLMLARLESGFERFDKRLAEFAVSNIAGEILERSFHIWHAVDVHGYLIIVAMRNEEEESLRSSTTIEPDTMQLLERLMLRVQHHVNVTLKGTISILLGEWAMFPGGLSASYELLLTAFRQQVGSDQQFFLKVMELPEQEANGKMQALTRLYEPPTLLHLLEGGRWDDACAKLDNIVKELDRKPFQTQEHLQEVYYSLLSAFITICHKNNGSITNVPNLFLTQTENAIRSPEQLKRWAHDVLSALMKDVMSELNESRMTVVQKVQQYIDRHLETDVSLHTLAKHAYIHPTHLSKIYKMETGEVLSHYIHRIRMERAAFLLKHTPGIRIYEVGERIGIDNTPYFIRLFKKYFGVTPQEYKEC